MKTTGGRGLHIVVPIAPRLDWSTCLEFARALAGALVRRQPARFTEHFAKAGRENKILVDYADAARILVSAVPEFLLGLIPVVGVASMCSPTSFEQGLGAAGDMLIRDTIRCGVFGRALLTLETPAESQMACPMIAPARPAGLSWPAAPRASPTHRTRSSAATVPPRIAPEFRLDGMAASRGTSRLSGACGKPGMATLPCPAMSTDTRRGYCGGVRRRRSRQGTDIVHSCPSSWRVRSSARQRSQRERPRGLGCPDPSPPR